MEAMSWDSYNHYRYRFTVTRASLARISHRTSTAAGKNYPEQVRRIRLKDLESDKTLVFLTNNTPLPALTIAALYKSRWHIELFFKWIKQHLRINEVSRHERERGEDTNLVRRIHLCAHR